MAGHGVADADTAASSASTGRRTRRHYRDELDAGHIVANAKVAESLFRKLLHSR